MAIKRFMMPLDYTGALPSNRVSGEIHTLAKTNYKLVVPFSGFFFTHNFTIYDEHDKQLERGTHFEFVYANDEVQMRTPGLEVCGALILKPLVKTNTVKINYNQVGGPYANYTKAIEKALIDLDLDGRTIDFSNLVNVPEYFIAGPHVEDVGNVFGFEYLRFGLDRLRDTLERSGKTTSEQVAGMLGDLIDNINQMFVEHTKDSKAHGTTAEDVGAYTKDQVNRIKLELESDIEKVKETVKEIEEGGSENDDKVQRCLTAINRLSRRLTVVDNLAKNAMRRYGGVSKSSSGNTEEIGNIKTSIVDVQNKVDDVNTKVDNVTKTVNDLSTTVNTVSKTVNDLSTTVNNLSKTVGDNDLALKALTTKVGNIESGVAAINKQLGDYLLKSAVAFGANKHADLVDKVPVINKDGVIHMASSMEWHAKGSVADYDVRETVQFNEEVGSMEIFSTGHYNCIDVKQRSDARDKTIVGTLSVERARAIIKHIGPASLYTLLSGTHVTSGHIAQRIQEVYPEAVTTTMVDEETETTRLSVSIGAMTSLAITALYGELAN